MDESVILKFAYSDWTLSGEIALWVPIAVVVVAGLYVAISRFNWFRRIRFGPFKTNEVRIKVAGFEVNLRPDYSTLRIAHQVWAEMATGKAGLEIDEEHDVIVEVYDSWNTLFGELRRLLKSIPAEELRDSNEAQKLVGLILQVMNGPLRDHLTRWQARFRRWFEMNADGDTSDPQEIQSRYPAYTELVEDLKLVNVELVGLTVELGKLVNIERGGKTYEKVHHRVGRRFARNFRTSPFRETLFAPIPLRSIHSGIPTLQVFLLMPIDRNLKAWYAQEPEWKWDTIGQEGSCS